MTKRKKVPDCIGDIATVPCPFGANTSIVLIRRGPDCTLQGKCLLKDMDVSSDSSRIYGCPKKKGGCKYWDGDWHEFE